MKRAFLFFILIAMILTACTTAAPAIAPTDTLTQHAVATQVSQILTAMPTATLPVSKPPVATATAPAVAPTAPQPTAPQPTAPQPTAPQPTATPSAPTATALPAGDPAAILGQPDWQDSFTTDLNWPTGEDQYTAINIENGYLKLTGLSTTAGWRLSYPELSDFYLEASIKTGECAANDHYGLIFRVPDVKEAKEGYLFGVSCEGKFSLRAWDGETMSVPVKWTASAAVVSGSSQVNRLGVLAQGSSLTLYVNGTQLAKVEDDTYRQGGFGLFVTAARTEDFTISAEKIAFWDLSE